MEKRTAEGGEGGGLVQKMCLKIGKVRSRGSTVLLSVPPEDVLNDHNGLLHYVVDLSLDELQQHVYAPRTPLGDL
jgi:hypothetical protein